MFEPKKATCCYCGRRTILRNTAHGGHELACGSCGAPLHVMKPLKMAQVADVSPKVKRTPERPGTRRKTKKTKSIWRAVASEIWDEIEDIFD